MALDLLLVRSVPDLYSDHASDLIPELPEQPGSNIKRRYSQVRAYVLREESTKKPLLLSLHNKGLLKFLHSIPPHHLTSS